MSNTIKKAKYQGWLWYSDQPKPEVIDDEFELTLDETKNPFIIEGQLWDGSRSVSIRFVDGKYLFNEFTVEGNDNGNERYDAAMEYIPHCLDGVNAVFMRQRWVKEKDELCEGMDVWKPAGNIFVGFKK